MSFFDFNVAETESIPLLGILIPLFILILILYMIQHFTEQIRCSKRLELLIRGIFILLQLSSLLIEYPIRYLTVGVSATTLPLHLCAFGAMASCVLLLTKSYFLYAFVCCGCLPGAFCAILFPALRHSFTHVLYYTFMISHMMIVISAYYCYQIFHYRVTKRTFRLIMVLLECGLLFFALVNDHFHTFYWFITFTQTKLDSTPFFFLGGGLHYFLWFNLLASLFFYLWYLLLFRYQGT